MSKVKKYIEDAVSAAVREVKTRGVEVSNCNFDSGVEVNVDNGDLTDVLLELAKAQSVIADAVVSISKSKPSLNVETGHALKMNGISDKPITFAQIKDEE